MSPVVAPGGAGVSTIHGQIRLYVMVINGLGAYQKLRWRPWCRQAELEGRGILRYMMAKYGNQPCTWNNEYGLFIMERI